MHRRTRLWVPDAMLGEVIPDLHGLLTPAGTYNKLAVP